MVTFPQYDDTGQEILSYQNIWREISPQSISGADCFLPEATVDNVENIMRLNLSGIEFREMFSALYNGAELTYPDRFLQIMVNFLKGIHCPPEIAAGDACTKYSATSSFVHYYPNHPDSETIPAGYILPAWYRFGEFDSIFPDWINDWINNAITDFTGYLPTDILCNIASFPINTIEAFLTNGGILPSFEVHVNGQGTVKLELLSFPLGGRACIKLDSPPNLIDLLTGGILDSATLYVDTVRDILSFPPEEVVTNTVSIEIDTLGDHILYVVFVPVIDDSLAFLGLGGGIRSIELCGFGEVANVGIESIIWEGCELKYVSGGVETLVATAAEIQACLDLPSGGGGGGGILPKVYDIVIGANLITTSAAFVNAAGLEQAHTFTKSKALIRCVLSAQNNGGQSSSFRIVMDTGSIVVGRDVVVGRTLGAAIIREIVLDDVFEDIPLGSQTLKIEFNSTGGQAAVIFAGYNIIWTIIEYDNASDLFVEDIRVLTNGDIEKKIGGVWLTVTESLAAKLAAIQSTANSAQTTANNALTTANGAVTVNTTQTAQIVALQAGLGDANLEITDIDDRVTSIETVDIPQINSNIANHETRIDDLEAASGGGATWGGYNLVSETDTGLALSDGTGRYSSATNTFESGAQTGWRRRASDGKIFLTVTNAHKFNSCHLLRVTIVADTYIGGSFRFRVDGGDWCDIRVSPSGTRVGWARVPNASIDNLSLEFESDNLSNNWRLTGLVYLCTDPLPFS